MPLVGRAGGTVEGCPLRLPQQSALLQRAEPVLCPVGTAAQNRLSSARATWTVRWFRDPVRSAAVGVAAACMVGLPLVYEVRRGQPVWDSAARISIINGYVGTVYACGETLERISDEAVEVVSVVPRSKMTDATVVAAIRGSRGFEVGALAFTEEQIPELGVLDVRGLKDPGEGAYRYLVLLRPDRLGEHRVDKLTVRYKRGLLTYETTAFASCDVSVTHASGEDPRAG